MKAKAGWIVAAAVVLAAAGWLLKAWSAESAEQREIDESVARVRSQIDDPQRLSDARVELDRILKRAPDRRDALLLRGEVLFTLSLFEEAQADLAKALRDSEGVERAEIQLLLGRVHHQRYRGTGGDDHFRLARNAFFDAQQQPATKPAALFALGMLFSERGSNRNLEKAVATLQQLVGQCPDSEEAPRAREVIAKLNEVISKGG